MNEGGSQTPVNESTRLASTRRELRRIGGLIFDARRHIGAGQTVNVVGLESMVREVCTTAQSLPADEGRELRPDMEAVLYDLDALATELTERYGDGARREGVAAPGGAGIDRSKG